MAEFLTTERLLLRRFRETDWKDLLEVRGNPNVVKYLDTTLLVTQGDALLLMEKYNDWNDGMKYAIELSSERKVIGGIGVFHINAKHRFGTIGYDINEKYWRKGFATEALTALINYCFGEKGLNRLEAHVHVENHPSQRLLEKLGFQREGLQRENFLIDGRFYNCYLYALIKSEWNN